MRTSAFLYPWDVVGDPDAAERVAELGLDGVAVAAAYHSVRALTPRHPAHRIVLAPHAAVYFEPGARRWRGRRLRPAAATWAGAEDAFGMAAGALRTAGLAVNAWVVLMHNSRLGELHPDVAVTNAYGDRYPWALCPAQEEVREYAATLVGDVADRYELDAVELEACGWYGFDHLSSHDKTAGVVLSNAHEYLLSLCFCPACERAYRDAGLDPAELRRRVTGALDAVFAGDGDAGGDTVAELLGADCARAILAARRRATDALRTAVVAAVDGPEVLLHADPDEHGAGANPGMDIAAALADVDGVVVTADETRLRAATGRGGRVVANVMAVAGLGGRPDELPARAADAERCGASEVRFYHAGLASARDLEAIAAVAGAMR